MHGRALLVLLFVAACAHRSTPTEDTKPVADAKTATPKDTTIVEAPWPSIETMPPKLTSKATEAGRPRGDRSRKLPGYDTMYVSLEPPAEPPAGEVHGNVVELRADAAGKPGVLRIEAADGRIVELAVTGPGQLVLAEGDVVSARWRSMQSGIHHIRDLGLVDADGRVIYASSGTGDASFAPGWHVDPKGIRERGDPHMRGGARRLSSWLVVAKGDVAGFVHESADARRLSTPDGDFAISGSAIDWTGGKRPPDSSSYQTFGIVRLP